MIDQPSQQAALVPNTEATAHLSTNLGTAESNATTAEDFPKHGKFHDYSGHKEYALSRNINERSIGRNWDEAKLEWDLVNVFKQPQAGQCLCGHAPITEHCVLLNRKNGKIAIVGSVCVQKFLGLPADKIFQAVKRIGKDPERSLNAETIDFAHKQGWIDEKDRTFYLDTMRMKTTGPWRKNVLSEKQLWRRVKINRKVLQGFHSAKNGPEQ